MARTSLVPRWRGGLRRAFESPFETIQRDMDRLFEDFYRFGLQPFVGTQRDLGVFTPSVDVRETEKTVEVHAELPGLTEKDIDVRLAPSRDMLTLRGEKRDEHKEEKEGFFRPERTFGAFHRDIPLPTEVDENKIEARYHNGILQVTLEKLQEGKAEAKRIDVKAS